MQCIDILWIFGDRQREGFSENGEFKWLRKEEQGVVDMKTCGYKALDKDMRAAFGNGMQFELGKSYSVERAVSIGENGFHFCSSIEGISAHYDIRESRIFEVEAYGTIKSDGARNAAESICLIRELPEKEIQDYFMRNRQKLLESSGWQIREVLMEQIYGGACL